MSTPTDAALLAAVKELRAAKVALEEAQQRANEIAKARDSAMKRVEQAQGKLDKLCRPAKRGRSAVPSLEAS